MIIVDELNASSTLQFHQAASQLRERLQRESATPPTATCKYKKTMGKTSLIYAENKRFCASSAPHIGRALHKFCSLFQSHQFCRPSIRHGQIDGDRTYIFQYN